jgi:CHASE3 domain sensor protein
MVFWLLAVLVSLLLAMAHITRMNLVNDHRNRLWMSLVTIEEASKALSDMEAGNRGFLLTGNQELRQPFNRGRDMFSSRYQTLLRLTAAEPMQQERLKTIKAKFTEWFTLYNPLIQKRRHSVGSIEPNYKAISRGNQMPGGEVVGSVSNLDDQAVLLNCNTLSDDIQFLLDEIRLSEEKRMADGDYPT